MADEPAEGARSPSRVRKRRWRRGLGIVCAIIVVLVVLVIALIPTLLSTGPGTSLLMGIINGSIDGSMEAQDLSLSWFGGQSARGVVLRDSADELIARVTEIDAPDVDLLPLALGSRTLGRVQVRVDEAHIEQAPGQPTNVERAMGLGGAAAEPAPEADQEVARDLSLQLDLTAHRVTYHSPDMAPVELANLSATASVPTLRDMQLELHSDLEQAGETGRVDADVSVRNAFTDSGAAQWAAAVIDGTADVTNLPVGMIDRLAQQEGRLSALLGDRLTASVQAAGSAEEMAAHVVARSPLLEVDAQLANEGGTLRGMPGSRATLRVTPASFAALSDGEHRLVEPFTLEARLSDLTAAEGTLERATVDATVSAGDIVLDLREQGRVAVRGASVAVRSEALSDLLTARLNAAVEIGGAAEPVTAVLSVRNLLRPDQPLVAALEARAVPVALGDAAAEQEGRLVRLLGRSLDVQIEVTQTAEGDVRFGGRVASQNLKGPFDGSYGKDGRLGLRTPEPVTLTLTAAAYADWMAPEGGGEPRLALVEAQPIAIDVKDFQLAYLDEEASRIDAERSRLVARLTAPAATFRDTATGERIVVEQGVLDVQAPTLRQAMNLLASFRIRPAEAEEAAAGEQAGAVEGAVESRTQVHGVISAAGELQPAKASIASQTVFRDVPSILVDSLMRQNGELAAILGETTSATAEVNYRPGAAGDATLVLEADNSQGRLAADISPEGVASLREPATLSLAVTREMSDVFLKSVNPLLVQAVGAERPITLTIDDEGFAAPLSELDLAAVSATASLDLGTLRLDNGGLLSLVLKTLGRDRPGQLVASFTPLNVRLEDGRLRYDDMTMTIDNVVLGFAGLVNLEQDTVDLTMSIPGSALRKIFQDLEDVIPPDYALRVPMRGPIDDPQVDTAALTAELAKLALKKNLGGREGEIVEGLLDAILGGSRERQEEGQ